MTLQPLENAGPVLVVPEGVRPAPRVRFNEEYFGFIVGFPDGEIVLTSPSARDVLRPDVSRAAVEPHLLSTLEIRPGFHLATPPLLWLELTRRCNLACPHCYIDGGKPRAGEIPTARWHELIDEIADMGVWAVAFTGGEPTLHPAFAELVRHARARDLLVGVATHGMFLGDALLDQLPRDGVILSVSIDDLHVGRRSHGSPGEVARASILRAQEHGFLTNIMTNTHRENIQDLAELMDWAETHGVSVRSVPLSPLGRGKYRRDLENTVEDVEHAARFWMRECEWEHAYHRAAGLCVGIIFNYGLTLAYMTRRCASGRYLAYIAADGTVFPCTMCAGEGIFPSGSVRDESFAAVWRSRWEIRQHSWADFEDTCHGCPINDDSHYCAARCPATSHARHGTFAECGASAFEIVSTIHRTALLDRSPTGRGQNLPAVVDDGPSAAMN